MLEVEELVMAQDMAAVEAVAMVLSAELVFLMLKTETVVLERH
jgi:hypothetical protein